MENVYGGAREFVLKNGSELQKTALLFMMDESDKKSLTDALKPYQNDDGGWANGLEAEYRGNVSSPMTTAAALSYLYLFGLQDTELLKKSLEYLEKTQTEQGYWDDPDSILQFSVPDYMGPGTYVEYKTGMNLKWLKRLEVENSAMLQSAHGFLLDLFPKVSLEKDMWTAIAYMNAFSEYQNAEETRKILQWAQQVLTPPGAFDVNDSQEPPEPPWMMIQGLLYDDSHLLASMKEQTMIAIRKNQLPSGGWPHPFGTYNAVWAAVLVVRYLKANGLI